MKTTKSKIRCGGMSAILALVLGLMVFQARVSKAAPMGTAFTYQGRLMDTKSPADGSYDLQFKLYDGASDGNQVGSTIDIYELGVIDGFFAVELDFGDGDPNVFPGAARWLEITVRPGEMNDPNVYTTLSPRQEIAPVPYSLLSRGIFVDADRNVGIGTTEPEAKLDIISATNENGIIVETTISSPNGVVAEFSNDSATPDGILLLVSSGQEFGPRFEIAADGTTYFSGNVGIGTVDPQAGLDVVVYDSNSSIKGTNWENGTGVYGYSRLSHGVYGEGGGGDGVHGKVSGSGNGVYGEHVNGNSGYLGGNYGAYGRGPSGSYGYLGSNNTGVYAEGSDFGIVAKSSGTAGYFDGDVTVTNGNMGVSGTLTATAKNFIQPHSVDPSKEIVYVAVEAPEAVVFIRGTAELKDGSAVIELPEYFRVVAAEDGVQVQVTPHSADTFGLAVVRRSHEKIVVKELKNGCGNFEFDYFVTAIRAGFEEHQVLAENTHFRPRADETAEEFEARYSRDDMTTKAIRDMLISNGILTEDSKLNMAKVKELGWEPRRKTTDEKIERVFAKKP